MVKENPKFLLYKLEESPRRLKETILSEKGVKENYIQNLFKENLSKIFDLIFLKEEHYLTNPDTGKKDFRADTLAFSKKGFFVIIEYKRGVSLELYQQTEGYISCLINMENQEECIHNRYELLNILNEEEKSLKWNYKNILWEETKGVCIVTEIDKRLQHHKRKKDENIKIIEIKFYDDRKILYIDTSNLPEWLTITSNEKDGREKDENRIYTRNQEISNILNGGEGWLVEVEDCIISLKPLERKDWKKGNLHRIRYYDKFTGKKIVSLIPKTKKINVYWYFKNPQEISESLKNLLGDYNIYHSEKEHGVGNSYWFFSVWNKNSLQELKNFITKYKEKFSERGEIF